MPPCLSYVDVVEAMEGRRLVPAWLALAEVLDRRSGWRFRLTDTFALWDRADRRRQFAIAEQPRRGRARFVVFQGGRHVDDVTWWRCESVAGLEEVLDALDRRRRPPGGVSIGPAAARRAAATSA